MAPICVFASWARQRFTANSSAPMRRIKKNGLPKNSLTSCVLSYGNNWVTIRPMVSAGERQVYFYFLSFSLSRLYEGATGNRSGRNFPNDFYWKTALNNSFIDSGQGVRSGMVESFPL